MGRRLTRLILATLLIAFVTGGSRTPTPVRWAASAPTRSPTHLPDRPAYQLPLAGAPHVTRPFQPPPKPWLPGHRGVDLAATPGAAVFAAGAGVVAFAGVIAGVGVLSIDHPGGLRTTYEPVTASVPAGQPVVLGQPVGSVVPGHPGCPVPACLHWGLRRGAQYLDPLLLLKQGQVRLLPTTPDAP